MRKIDQYDSTEVLDMEFTALWVSYLGTQGGDALGIACLDGTHRETKGSAVRIPPRLHNGGRAAH